MTHFLATDPAVFDWTPLLVQLPVVAIILGVLWRVWLVFSTREEADKTEIRRLNELLVSQQHELLERVLPLLATTSELLERTPGRFHQALDRADQVAQRATDPEIDEVLTSLERILRERREQA